MGAIMNLRGTISDFDRVGLFDLVIADDESRSAFQSMGHTGRAAQSLRD
jgi:hypothetical protein